MSYAGTIRGVVLRQGDSWVVRNVGGTWPIIGRVELHEGHFVEGLVSSARRIEAESLQKSRPATFEEAVDELLLSVRYPLVGWYDARRIVKVLGPSAAEQLRDDPRLLHGLVRQPMRVMCAWAGIGTIQPRRE